MAITVCMEHVDKEKSAHHARRDDAMLLRLFVERNDRTALSELILRHAESAFHFARRLSACDADAEDAVQTAFMTMMAKASSYRGVSSVKTWMLGFVAHACRVRHRAEVRRADREVAATVMRETRESASAEELRVAQEARDAVLRAVESLPPAYCAPLWLRYYEDLSAAEVACVLNEPEKTVRNQLGLALEQLRVALARAGYTHSMAALPALFGALALHAPSQHWLASVKTLAAQNASISPVVGSATKAGLAHSLLGVALFSIAIILTAMLGLRVASQTGEEAAPNPAPVELEATTLTKPSSDTAAIPAVLADKLKQPVSVDFRRDYASEVVAELERKSGVSMSAPGSNKNFHFTYAGTNVSAGTILTRLIEEGGFTVDYRGDHVVLWKRADDKVLKPLLAKLKSSAIQERCDAVYELSRLSDERVYPPLFAALFDAEPAVVSWTVNGLLNYHSSALRAAPHPEVAVQALERLLENPSPSISPRKALGLISALQNDRAVTMLMERLHSTDSNVRANAADAVGKGAHPTVRARLLQLLGESDIDVRRSAALALVRNADPHGITLMIEMIGSPDSLARKRALESIGNLQDPRLCDALVAALNSPDTRVQEEAVHALQLLGDPSACDALMKKMITLPDVYARLNCVWALAASRDPRLKAWFENMYKSDNEDDRVLGLGGLCVMRESQVWEFVSGHQHSLTCTTFRP